MEIMVELYTYTIHEGLIYQLFSTYLTVHLIVHYSGLEEVNITHSMFTNSHASANSAY